MNEGPEGSVRGGEGEQRETRCGYVAVLGLPNAGKSTLTNRLVGAPLSIVSSKAQTTWRRVTAILTEDESQLIFLDTPGLLTPGTLLQAAMRQAAEAALAEADVLLWVVEATGRDSTELERLAADLGRGDAPAPVVALNKVDLAGAKECSRWEAWARDTFSGAKVVQVSATTGKGISELRKALIRVLPPGPFLYPEDEVGIDPIRDFVAEFIRETIFEQYRDEIPYSSICRVEEFREGGERTYIGVTVFVERDSQKGILVGKGGKGIRRLGVAARKRIEAFLDTPVYLDLWVKVLPNWRRKKEHLRRFGFRIPDAHDETMAWRN